jgi:hypothetical protein
MSKIPLSFRRFAFFALAILLGTGAFNAAYSLTKYTAGPICYYGNNYTATSYVSQADANAKMQAKLNENPGNYSGTCNPNTPPATPGAP